MKGLKRVTREEFRDILIDLAIYEEEREREKRETNEHQDSQPPLQGDEAADTNG